MDGLWVLDNHLAKITEVFHEFFQSSHADAMFRAIVPRMHEILAALLWKGGVSAWRFGCGAGQIPQR